MLPAFDERGYLPPGIHQCAVDELIARFGYGSPERQSEGMEIVDFITWARQAGIKRLLVDGSFVTSKPAPNDVDVVILPGEAHPEQGLVALELAPRWPFLHIQVAQDQADLEQWARVDFGVDRDRNPRGLVEVAL